MPEIALSPGVALFYRDDDFTDPWGPAEAVLLLHGNSESSLAWNSWMPVLGRRMRVIRPDMRGFGRSTPMPVDHAWSLDELARDFVAVMDALEIERFHLVGSKVGAGVALRLAATNPKRVRTLTVLGARLISGKPVYDGQTERVCDEILRDGVAAWARGSMRWRLGSDCPDEMVEGWVEMMKGTPVSTAVGFIRAAAETDVNQELPRIECPTLVIITAGKGNNAVADARAKQEQIPNARLLVLPGDSQHIAVTEPDFCASATLDLIEGARATA